MTAKERHHRHVLTHLAQTRTVDGVLVIVGCTQVASATCVRFEVKIQGDSEIAIYDVAGTDEAVLPDRIAELTETFLAAYKLR